MILIMCGVCNEREVCKENDGYASGHFEALKGRDVGIKITISKRRELTEYESFNGKLWGSLFKFEDP